MATSCEYVHNYKFRVDNKTTDSISVVYNSGYNKPDTTVYIRGNAVQNILSIEGGVERKKPGGYQTEYAFKSIAVLKDGDTLQRDLRQSINWTFDEATTTYTTEVLASDF
jgi:hypothetical protein